MSRHEGRATIKDEQHRHCWDQGLRFISGKFPWAPPGCDEADRGLAQDRWGSDPRPDGVKPEVVVRLAKNNIQKYRLNEGSNRRPTEFGNLQPKKYQKMINEDW